VRKLSGPIAEAVRRLGISSPQAREAIDAFSRRAVARTVRRSEPLSIGKTQGRLAKALRKGSALTKKASDDTTGADGTYSDDSYVGQERGAPTRVHVPMPRKGMKLMQERRKSAAVHNPESPEEGRLGPDRQMAGPPALKSMSTLVNPEMSTYQVVNTMGRLEMSREEKAAYLGKAGFQPQAISAILAQVDGYTESSEV
jgi:hypothetical protein